jgi:hypothetical protein
VKYTTNPSSDRTAFVETMSSGNGTSSAGSFLMKFGKSMIFLLGDFRPACLPLQDRHNLRAIPVFGHGNVRRCRPARCGRPWPGTVADIGCRS